VIHYLKIVDKYWVTNSPDALFGVDYLFGRRILTYLLYWYIHSRNTIATKTFHKLRVKKIARQKENPQLYRQLHLYCQCLASWARDVLCGVEHNFRFSRRVRNNIHNVIHAWLGTVPKQFVLTVGA